MRYHGKNLRKGRFSIPHQIYLLTFATEGRLPLFRSFQPARLVLRTLVHSPNVQTLAIVVMPDHVHWLIQLNPTRQLSRSVQIAKATASRRFNGATGHEGAVWQKGFHDHALRDDRAVKEIARYIVANPVRAGLVNTVGDYPHWDAIWV